MKSLVLVVEKLLFFSEGSENCQDGTSLRTRSAEGCNRLLRTLGRDRREKVLEEVLMVLEAMKKHLENATMIGSWIDTAIEIVRSKRKQHR